MNQPNEDKFSKTSHEVFTNLPNNTLNGLNPINENKIDNDVDMPILKENKGYEQAKKKSDFNVKTIELIIIFVITILILGSLLFNNLYTKKANVQTKKTTKTTTTIKNTLQEFDLYQKQMKFDDYEVININDENTLKELKDDNSSLFKIVTDGSISINNIKNTYEPLIYGEEKIKYLYYFYDSQKFYIVSTKGFVHALSYSKDENGLIDTNTLQITRYESILDKIEMNRTDLTGLEIKLIFKDNNQKFIYKVIGFDNEVSDYEG